MKKKRILFFPHEVGIAHITRSLAVAEELKKRGNSIVFALPKRKWYLYKTAVDYVDVLPIIDKDGIDVLDMFTDRDRIESMAKDDYRLIMRYKPDRIVCDLRMSSAVAGYSAQIPTIFYTTSGGLPGGCFIPNRGWPEFIHPFIAVLIKKLVKKVKLPIESTLEEVSARMGKPISMHALYKYMSYLVPEPKGYLSDGDNDYSISYCGPIFWDGFKTERPKWLTKLQPDGNTIYLTFGGTGFDTDKMILLTKELLSYGYRVIITTSILLDKDDFPQDKNLFIAKHADGFEIARRVDLVVCHGGYGTMTQAVFMKIPVIAIPSNPDQIVHSMRFEELGLGKSLHKITPSFISSMLNGDWKGLEEEGSVITVDAVLNAVKEVLSSRKEYVSRIQQTIKKWDYKNSVHNAADFIERI